MKLRSVEIKNFRLLKELQLDFSVDEDKPLTVIRAANESGKTTCKTALIWCLYGSKALPDKGNSRLAPGDEIGQDNDTVEISVEIEFELEHASDLGRGNHSIQRSIYRLIRSCHESIGSDETWRRVGETRNLWRVTPVGTEHVEDEQVTGVIESALPKSLKDVYVTDGDRALSFIEGGATQGIKRKRVASAIESLLGLNVIDQTIKNMTTVANRFSQEIDNKDYAEELENLNDRIAGYEEDIENWTEELEEADREVAELGKNIETKQGEIDEALKLGDKEKLIERRKGVEKKVQRTSTALSAAEKTLASVVSSESASKAFLKKHIESSQELLDGMSQSKQLPKVNVPILEELLTRDVCFCGSELRSDTGEGKDRRDKIERAIESSRESDLIQESASSLYYRVRSIDVSDSEDSWIGVYANASQQLYSLRSTLHELELEAGEVQDTVDAIDDSHLNELREQKEQLNKELKKQINIQASRNTQIDDIKQRWRDAETERLKVRNRLGKTNTSAENWDIAATVKNIFSDIINILKEEELAKVSWEMKRIFLAMIGADSASERVSGIKSAELTKQFDIKVYGSNGRELDPDQDLNGASRRAITIAFILALTKVSEVEAPNIIDTPLGMMSGYVKQSVLLRTIEEGSQVILFLTHDEIEGVEDILDKYAGKVFTLTNPAHYPIMLAHDPGVNELKVLRCECSHRESCEICERKQLKVA